MAGATLKLLMFSHKALYTCTVNRSDTVTKNNYRHSEKGLTFLRMNAEEKHGAHAKFIFGCMHDSNN
jgi:hypothetical protein